ncbi:hypothetical protein [Streptomyces sp. NPDC053427]
MSPRPRGRHQGRTALPLAETVVIAAYENVPGAPSPAGALHD